MSAAGASMASKKIVILTGSELRHQFFRKYMALQPGIQVLRSYCEGTEKSLSALVAQESSATGLRERHLQARDCAERDFFGLFLEHAPDHSNPLHLPKGDINEPEHVDAIIRLQPDIIVAYGCSIIRGALLEAFDRRILNAHLGLSPWYRGSGTNFWPLVNGEPEFVGVTFMYLDAGVDTGEIIHQIRARVCHGDTPHTMGNRLIARMAKVYADVVRNFDRLKPMPQPPVPETARYYRKKDFSEEAVRRMLENFRSGMVEDYLANMHERTSRVPLVKNPALMPPASGMSAQDNEEPPCH